MSHFTVAVILPEREPYSEKTVYDLMSPYQEGDEWFEDGTRWDWYVVGGRWDGDIRGLEWSPLLPYNRGWCRL